MMNYAEARAFMAKARNAENGRPLQNNTRMYERQVHDGTDWTTAYAIELHSTYVVTILPGDMYALRTGGWYTPTTQNRINGWSPARVYSHGGEWMLPLEPDPNDPAPERISRTVPKPFVAADPGPEPVKSNDGCIAGELGGVTKWKKTLTRLDELDIERPAELADLTDTPRRGKPSGVRSRRLLQWMRAVETGLIWVNTWVTEWTEYGEAAWGQSSARPDGKVRYEQCPHCREFAQLHANWSQKMEGAWRGSQRVGGYATYVKCMARYGDTETWTEAYKADGRNVRANHLLCREWSERNWVPFEEGATVNYLGHLLREDHASYIADVLDKQEREAIERTHRKERARIKARLRRQRQRDPNYLGNQLVKDLQNIRSNLGGRVMA